MAATFYNPLVISIAVAESAPQTFTAMRPIAVVDALASVTTAAAFVTAMQVSSAAGNVTNNIVLGNNINNNVGRATTIISANGKIAVGGTLTFTQSGTGTASRVSVIAVAN
jgi:hypothetical protein